MVGLDGVIVEVEVDTADGLPGMMIVGLPDAAVQESRERVQAAIKNAGLFYPRYHDIVTSGFAKFTTFTSANQPPLSKRAYSRTVPIFLHGPSQLNQAGRGGCEIIIKVDFAP